MVLKRKALLSIFAILVVIGCMASTILMASAVNADGVTANPVDEAAAQAVTDGAKATGSYTNYLNENLKSGYSSESVEPVQLNGAVLKNEPVEFTVNVEKEGLYYIGMSYKALTDRKDDIRIGIKIDGEFPFANMDDLHFPRIWCDDPNAKVTKDSRNNEYVPEQVVYSDYYYFEAYDEVLEASEKFMVKLTAGEHKVSIIPNLDNIKAEDLEKGIMEIEYFKFAATKAPAKYKAPSKSQYYKGEPIVIEGEKAMVKSSYFLVGSAEQGSMDVTPYDIETRRINYIGNNWSTVGDTLVWKTNVKKSGYYQLSFSFRQNTVIGAKSYRTLTIDGEVPFAEAANIGFKYGDNWQQGVFADNNNKPYLIYLEAGEHEIAMTVTASEMAEVRTMLTQAVAEMGDLYVDMTKITGETVDIYRDYDLFRQIGDMESRLKNIKKLLENSANTILKVTGEDSGSNYSVIMNMLQTVNQMLNNKYEAHRYKGTYYTNYCAVASVLLDLRSMPLLLDKFALSAPGTEPFEKHNFFEKTGFSAQRFFYSFVDDYADDEGDENTLTIWVNWGRDQAQVLSALIDRRFTPEYHIDVNLKLVNASIIQAVLSGKGPDLVLQHAKTEPVNLAMRGVLYDLTKFPDYKEVLSRFQTGADNPFWYKGGLYGLPDSQSFPVLFYRKDILAEYGIKEPDSSWTWDDFEHATKLLMRNNMNVCLPSSTATDSLFPTLLLQNGLNLYADGGKSTNLRTPESAEIFEQWTNYYTKLKVPISMDFYNRFRTGTTPLGVSAYTLYTQLKVAAPEIEGLWSFTMIPGTVNDKGEIMHNVAGTSTACSILQMAADNGREDEAWKFLKWWTSYETQLAYSNDVETILGPTGRVAVANKQALEELSWDGDTLNALKDAREWVTEIPEYPGSYYVQRSIYQAYWNVVNNSKNTKDMLAKFGKEADDEIARKWKQYDENRGK